MGSDDLHKKRRVEKERKIKRYSQHRERKPRYLVVCEDEKSSRYYFENFKESPLLQKLQLSFDLTVQPCALGPTPNKVLEHAVNCYEDEEVDDPYTEVFCVIDRDQHEKFDETIREFQRLKKEKKPFREIVSYPSFEYWLLLHFEYTSRDFSSANDCLKTLNNAIQKERKKTTDKNLKNLPEKYEKHQKNWFTILQPQLQSAIKNAQKSIGVCGKLQKKNPSTEIHWLLEELGLTESVLKNCNQPLPSAS